MKNHKSVAYYIQWFKDYVASFSSESAQYQFNIELKKQHSLRVYKESLQIISTLTISEKMAWLVHIAALFHDIGRFSQYITYKTFNDYASKNHGLIGYKELKKRKILDDMLPREKKFILLTVLMHNRAKLPTKLPNELLLLLNIVRDADKLDIISVLLDHFEKPRPENNTVTLNLKNNPEKYSSFVLNQVFTGNSVTYKNMVWINDFKLLICSWIYDLHFSYTKNALLKRNFLKRIFLTLPQNEEMECLNEQLTRDLKKASTIDTNLDQSLELLKTSS